MATWRFSAGGAVLELVTICACCSLFVVFARDVSAGPWTRARGGGYLLVESSFVRAVRERNHRNEVVPLFNDRLNAANAEYREVVLRAYGEYGLLSRLTFVGAIASKYVEDRHMVLGGNYFESFSTSSHAIGFADATVGARFGILTGHIPFAMEGTVTFPTGYDGAPLDGGPPLGTGWVDGDIRLSVGGSAPPGWSAVMLGYRVRGGPYHDDVIWQGTVGAGGRRWQVETSLDGVMSTRTPQDLAAVPVTFPLPDGGGAYPVLIGNQDILQLFTSAAHRIGRMWLRLGWRTVVAGRNTLDSSGISFGIVAEH